MGNFTQNQFNTDHAEPREYGEGDYYVVGDNYSDEKAAQVIGQWETDLTGEEHKYTAADITVMKMFVGRNEDSEEDWVLNNWEDKLPVAWGKGIAR